MEPLSRLSVHTEPHDALRDGFHPLDTTSTPAIYHPVQAIQHSQQQQQQKHQDYVLARTYGVSAPMKNRLEQQMLKGVGRLPLMYGSSSMSSSRLAYDIVTGKDEDIDMADYMNLPSNDPSLRTTDIHTQMETLAKDTPFKRFS